MAKLKKCLADWTKDIGGQLKVKSRTPREKPKLGDHRYFRFIRDNNHPIA